MTDREMQKEKEDSLIGKMITKCKELHLQVEIIWYNSVLPNKIIDKDDANHFPARKWKSINWNT